MGGHVLPFSISEPEIRPYEYDLLTSKLANSFHTYHLLSRVLVPRVPIQGGEWSPGFGGWRVESALILMPDSQYAS